MNKTILLELTEKEANAIDIAMGIQELNFTHGSGMTFSEKERALNTCKSVRDKIEEAIKPKEDLAIFYKDFHHIKNLAHDQFFEQRADIHISHVKVGENDLVHISLANAMIMWLNSKGLLKRLAKFDVTDSSLDFESNED